VKAGARFGAIVHASPSLRTTGSSGRPLKSPPRTTGCGLLEYRWVRASAWAARSWTDPARWTETTPIEVLRGAAADGVASTTTSSTASALPEAGEIGTVSTDRIGRRDRTELP
jgi:hypothetical protein